MSLTPEQLAEWYLKLQDVGHVQNINLVTPEQSVPRSSQRPLADITPVSSHKSPSASCTRATWV